MIFRIRVAADIGNRQAVFSVYSVYRNNGPERTVPSGPQWSGKNRPLRTKKVGEVSVTYTSETSSASMSNQTDLADLTETPFGLQLLSLLKLYSMTRYVP